jgi:hypothetical protein
MQQPVITGQAAKDLALGKNGSYSNEGNVLQHVLYDTIAFPAATAATQTFFSVPQGATKQLTETNLLDPSKLPNGQTFLIKGISLAGMFGVAGADTDANTVLAAFYNVIQNSTFEIKIAGREFDLQVPGTKFLPPYPISAIASAANPAFPQATTISTGHVKLNTTPIPIGQLVSFNVLQKCSSATAAIATIINTAFGVLNTQNAQLQVRLDGILTRAI